MKSTGVQAVNGATVGRYLKAVQMSDGVSIKNYVFVHVVSKDCTGVTKRTIMEDWLINQEVPVEKKMSDDFRSECCACIIEMSWDHQLAKVTFWRCSSSCWYWFFGASELLTMDLVTTLQKYAYSHFTRIPSAQRFYQ